MDGVMKKIPFFILSLFITVYCYAQPSSGGSPNSLWQEIDGTPSIRARTIIVPNNSIISTDGSTMSLDIVNSMSADITYWHKLSDDVGLIGNKTGQFNIDIGTGTLGAGTAQVGLAGTTGILKLYSEQGATDYTTSLYPNAAMISAASYYLPADEPPALSIMIMGTDGVIGFTNAVTGGGASGRLYYPENSVASDLTGYKVALATPSANAESDISISCVTQNAYVLGEEFATASGQPNVTSLPAGTAVRYAYAKISGGTGQLKLDLFRYKTTGNEATTGSVSLAFADNGATADTITWAGGTFITNNFTAGAKITVAGGANAGTYTIQSLSETVLTLILSDVISTTTYSTTITTKEKLLRTGSSPLFINMAAFDFIQFTYTDSSAYVFATDDRIIFKWWGRKTTAGGTQTITVETEGTTAASYIQTTLNVPLAALSSSDLATALTDETGTGLAVFGTSPSLTTPAIVGSTMTGVHDAGGATSFEVPNTAGDVTVDAAGEIAIDSTNKQLAVYDGAAEVAIPLRHIFQGSIDLAGAYDVDPDVWLWNLDATTYPNGIYITAVYLDSSVADPTTEIDANLMYCDAVANGAFPGANATLIKAIDTTTGNFADAAVNTAVATGKTIYIDLDADPTDATTVYNLRIYYRIPES